jgi:tape measure domain-containing protein
MASQKYSVSTSFKAIDGISKSFIRMGKKSDLFKKKAKGAFATASKSGSMFGAVVGGNLVSGAISKGMNLATGAMTKFVNEARKIEDAQASFTPLMGSVDKARKLVSRLNKEAATTPFEFQGIANVAKQLLPVMNGSIENTADTFRMLGDTAGGNIQKLDSITRGYVKAMLKGKPDMEALNMIAEAGVPIFSEMSKSMGIAQSQLFEMSKQGKLTTNDLTKAFKRMTSEGGIFYKGMEISSETVSGRFSTLRDNINLTIASIGLKLFPTIKKLTTQLITTAQNVKAWVDNNSELLNQKIDEYIASISNFIKKAVKFITTFFKIVKKLFPIIKKLVPLFIAWQASIVAVNVAMKAMAIIGMIGKFLQFVKIIMMITKAKSAWAAVQWALNVAMNANPIGLITIAVFALIAGIILLVKNWDKVVSVAKSSWEWIKRNYDMLLLFIPGIGNVVSMIINLVKHWDDLKESFKSGGIIGAIKMIGKVILDSIISPIQKILNVIAKIPKIGGIAKAASAELNNFRLPDTQVQAPNAAKEQTRIETSAKISGRITVGTESGTRASVSGGKGLLQLDPAMAGAS